jgi:tripartite-type tricarboxylate transporter receptor subunit TctC
MAFDREIWSILETLLWGIWVEARGNDEASAWVGIGAPRNTPIEIIEELNTDINAGLTDPKLGARFAELGATVFVGSPADFGRFIANETEKWAKVVKFAGIKPN